MSYLNHFQRQVDQIEGRAWLLYRRFERLGLNIDVLAIDINLMAKPDEDKEEANMQPSDLEKKVFREFTGEEFAEIQYGRLVASLKGGLNEAQEIRYRELRDLFIGAGLLADYIDAQNGHGDYSPDEILRVARENGGLSEGFVKEELGFAKELMFPYFDEERAMAGRTPREPAKRKEQEIPSRAPELAQNQNSFDKVTHQIDSLIEEIDRYLMTRI